MIELILAALAVFTFPVFFGSPFVVLFLIAISGGFNRT